MGEYSCYVVVAAVGVGLVWLLLAMVRGRRSSRTDVSPVSEHRDRFLKDVRITKVIRDTREQCRVVTLSGFQPDNPLRARGELNFYVPSESYGFVEITHLAVCHCIVDTIIAERP